MEVISTKNSLKPAGHYSQAIVYNDLVFVSGQVSIDPETGEYKFGTIEEETMQVLNNIELILKEVNCNKNDILKTTVYIPEMSLWSQINKIYSQFFGEHKPARTVVPTRELNLGFKVEIEAIAVKR